MNSTANMNTISIECRIIDAIKHIQANKNRTVIVCRENKVVGIISEGDILRCLLEGGDVHSSIELWLNVNFKFLRNYDERAALSLFRQHGITMIPVVNEDFSLNTVILLSQLLQKLELTTEEI